MSFATFLGSLFPFKKAEPRPLPCNEPASGHDVSIVADPVEHHAGTKNQTTEFHVGQELTGHITGILDYGIFVRLSHHEVGLVYKTDIQWEGQNKTFRCGQKVKVKVLGFKAGRGLSLSIKRAYLRDLFNEFRTKHGVGEILPGRITSVKDYGLFVMLTPGVQGFIHSSDAEQFSQFSKSSIGSKINVKILDIEDERMRIQLCTRGVLQ